MPLQIFYNRRAPSKWMLELVNETVSAGKDVEGSEDEFQSIIAKRSANETQYDDSIVRQMIECIKVHSD